MIRSVFFSEVKKSLFGGRLTQSQVDGMEAILDEWDRRQLKIVSMLAYMFATVFHETARTMQPIREFGRGRGHKYGTIYYGRGFVQLTWETNYRKASAVVGVNLVKSPDRALELPIATDILFDGMLRGWFTGKKLSDYFTDVKTDYVNARRIINGTDRASLIAVEAEKFAKAIVHSAADEVQAMKDFESDAEHALDPLPPPMTPSPKPEPDSLAGTTTITEATPPLFRKNGDA